MSATTAATERMSTINKIADVIACLVKSPRTVDELHKVTGVSLDPVRGYMKALEAEGLVASEFLPRVDGKHGGKASVLYRWVA